jgi:DNA-binding MarR family transcriptional regulator
VILSHLLTTNSNGAVRYIDSGELLMSDPAIPADKNILDFEKDFYSLGKAERDHLLAISRLGGAAKGLAVNAEVEQLTASSCTHGTTYPTLDALAQKDLITKEPRDKRTNEYALTSKGKLTIRGGLAAFTQPE